MAPFRAESAITHSVGAGGVNRADDFEVVQALFGMLDFVRVSPVNPFGIGLPAPATVDPAQPFQSPMTALFRPPALAPAPSQSGPVNPLGLAVRIRKFQAGIGFPMQNGRIDVGSRTLAALVEKAALAQWTGSVPAASSAALNARIERALTFAVENAMTEQMRIAAILRPGGAGKLTDADFAAAAERLKPGVEAAMIRAFAEVESGGKSGFGASGLPVIAYEGHIFRKYSKHIYDQTHPLLSYPYVKKAGPQWRQNNKDQDTAWKTLETAMELNREAALLACSWGMFQVMAFNYSTCGFADVEAFVDSMKAGERGQLDAFVGFCLGTAGLRKALADKNYALCATLYNGDDYGDYDKRIERAYARWGGA